MAEPVLRFKDNQGQEFPPWEEKKLGDITCQIKNGFSYRWDSKRNHRYKVTRIESISSGKINLNRLGSVEAVDERYLLQEGDILFSHINSLPYLGNNAVYHENMGEIYHGMNLLSIRGNDEITQQFLYYLLNSPTLKRLVKAKAQQAVNQCSISTTTLKGLDVTIPCIEEQGRIADFLGWVDREIEVEEQRLESLQKRKLGLLQRFFNRTIRFRDSNGREFPPWEEKRLGDITHRLIVGLATTVTPYYRDKGIPILRNLNIKENRLDDSDLLYLDNQYASKQSNKMIHTGDVITVHTGYVGISCIVPPKYNNCLTFTTLITTTNKQILNNRFFCQYINSPVGLNRVYRVISSGGRNNLNTGDFVNYAVPVPSLEEQRKIADFFGWVDREIEVEEHRLETMKAIKKGLLQQMFI